MRETIGMDEEDTGAVENGEALLDAVELGSVETAVTEEILWRRVTSALERVVDYFVLGSGAVYASEWGNYTDMKREVLVPAHLDVADAFGLPTYDDFKFLAQQDGMMLPTKEHDLWWFSPTKYFASEFALVFGRETSAGYLIMLGFGWDGRTGPNASQEAEIVQVVSKKLFPFIERSLSSIQLDYLMSETGHLMGRSAGMIASGYDALMRVVRSNLDNSEDAEELRLALWALEDGLTRLELIRQRFYTFRERRLGSVGGLGDDAGGQSARGVPEGVYGRYDVLHRETVDIIRVLADLTPFFRRSAQYCHLGEVRLSLHADSAVTEGRERDLRLVFVNLFDNAVKYAYTDTHITIASTQEEGHCVVTFTNLGIGVAPDETEWVFRRFTRSRFRDPFRLIEGLGIGLYLCRTVVEDEFNGTITLSSRPAGRPRRRRFEGDNWLTTVAVRLPIKHGKEMR